nr:DUF6440 family protein [Murimonas intestini]
MREFNWNGREKIFIDKETEVNCIFVQAGVGGLTPLLDADGKPVITRSWN